VTDTKNDSVMRALKDGTTKKGSAGESLLPPEMRQRWDTRSISSGIFSMDLLLSIRGRDGFRLIGR
jgi:hypothetical protein